MSLQIVRADGLVTVQDQGRHGYAHLGVPRAGALDRPAADLANRLVGNRPDAAVLETTMLGVAFRVDAATTFAVTGARAAITTDGRQRPFAEPVTVPAGTEVAVGPALEGVRSYIAVSGGILVPEVLGSRSTDSLAWVGPPRVVTGVRLPVGPAGRPRPVESGWSAHRATVLRVIRGPRLDWFTKKAVGDLAAEPYAVLPASNRVGLRLSGRALERRRDEELASEGMVLGAVQVPPDGQPIVFLHDHPQTGGYPVVGVVIAEDLPVCAQARPGDRLTFRWVEG